MRRHSEAGYEVAGIYAEPHENLPSQVRRLHSLDQLHAFVLEHGVREIWIVLPMEAGQELREVLYHLRNDLVDVRWIPDVLSIQLLGHRIGDFLGLPAIQLNTLPAAGVRGLARKRSTGCSRYALIGLSPVMLTVAALVKLSSRGPVLFTSPPGRGRQGVPRLQVPHHDGAPGARRGHAGHPGRCACDPHRRLPAAHQPG